METRSEFAESVGESEEDDNILEVMGAKVEATGGHAGQPDRWKLRTIEAR